MTDQPMPTPGREDVFASLLDIDLDEHLRRRNAKGLETYGRTLETFNGRDAHLDAFEEALDLLVYLEQMRMERAVLVGLLREAYARTNFHLCASTTLGDGCWWCSWREHMRDILGPDPEAWR